MEHVRCVVAESMAERRARKVALFNSGAEGVENACKVARAATGRNVIIAFDRAFHGRTMFTLGLTGKTRPYKHNYGPLLVDIVRAPFPWLYRAPEGLNEETY